MSPTYSHQLSRSLASAESFLSAPRLARRLPCVLLRPHEAFAALKIPAHGARGTSTGLRCALSGDETVAITGANSFETFGAGARRRVTGGGG